MKFKSVFAACLLAVSFTACTSYKDVPYFQDLANPANSVTLKSQHEVLRIEPGDKLQILVVSALTPELAEGFNLYSSSTRYMSTSYSNNNSKVLAYHVDTNGDIDFPVLGKIRVKGMTREEVAVTIKNLLQTNKLLDEVVVNCEILNHYVNVIGDAKNVGRIPITEDHMTVIELLAQCGDLPVTGERKNVMVIREENGEYKPHFLDLTSAEQVYNSEVFYLKPDDVVYVNPNKTKQRGSMASGNFWATPSTYIGLFGTLMSLTSVIVAITK